MIRHKIPEQRRSRPNGGNIKESGLYVLHDDKRAISSGKDQATHTSSFFTQAQLRPLMGHFLVADTGDTEATVGTAQAPSVLGPAQRHEKQSLQHSVLMAGSSTRLLEVRILVDWSAGVGAEILGAGFSSSAQDRPQVRAEEGSGA
jgi:hypothetical protein